METPIPINDVDDLLEALEVEEFGSQCERCGMEFTTKEVPEHECLVPLKCPNCYKNMELVEKNVLFREEKYDRWDCPDCSHIICLDFRGDDLND